MHLRDLVLEWAKEKYPIHKWSMNGDTVGEDLYAIFREISKQYPPAGCVDSFTGNSEIRRAKQAMIYVRGSNQIFVRLNENWEWYVVQAVDPLSFQKISSTLESWQERWA